MSAVAVAIAGGVATLGGAIISGSAAQTAANTESQAATSANQLQYQEWLQQQQEMQPYLQSGTTNLAALNAAMPSLTSSFTMQDFQQSPGYQFQLSQGELAMQRSAAASGMLNSVGTQQNLNNYAQGMATTDYQQALTNFINSQQQRYNMLAGMAGMGLTATNMSNQVTQNYANQSSANTTSAANATAAGQVGTANAISGGLSNTANSYMGYSMLNNLIGQNQNPYAATGSNSLIMPQIGSSVAPQASSYGLGVNTNLASALY